MRKALTVFVLTLVSVICIDAQQEATTSEGRKVILNADGTWKFKVPEGDLNSKAVGNDCSNWIVTMSDKMTGQSYTSGKPGFLVSNDGGKTGFVIITMIASNSVILNFTVAEPGTGCVDDNTEINFLFRDGSRLTLNSSTKFNCDGKATLYFGGLLGNENALTQLKSKPVETIRVSTRKSYVQRDLTTEQSRRLMSELTCLDSKR